jgi:hypothetical protein
VATSFVRAGELMALLPAGIPVGILRWVAYAGRDGENLTLRRMTPWAGLLELELDASALTPAHETHRNTAQIHDSGASWVCC